MALTSRTSALRRHGLAEPAVLALLQEAQQAGLGERRELGHLVEEQRAALGLGHVAVARGDGAGEGPARVAEQLRDQQVVADARRVHRHERAARARRQLVQRPSHALLAGSRLAADVHPHVARSELPHVPSQGLDRRATAHEAGERSSSAAHPSLLLVSCRKAA